ncbi:MAG: HAD-IC family P-type ATPase [Patescibacteria group bacterium]
MSETAWYKLSGEEALRKLNSGVHGLGEEEVKNRQAEFGLNALPQEKGTSRFTLFLNQFKSALVYILLIAAIVSFVLGDFLDAYVILAAVVVNVIIGFFQEDRAQNALKKLKEVIKVMALVFRGNQEKQIPADNLVPGDIILLYAGYKVPADGRIISAKNLRVNEASLTGESYPVEKASHKLEKDLGLADRNNLVYMGTVITEGSGRAVVTETGDRSEIGRIAALVRETPEDKTPLQVKLARFSRQLAFTVLSICALLLLIGLLSGKEFVEMFTTAVAVAVSAIPEGLLIAVTLILTVGMQRILKRKALTRNLMAAETLGSTTVICTDKTGTLTLGMMNVSHIITYNHDLSTDKQEMALEKDGVESYMLALKIGMICNDAFVENEADELKDWRLVGNPTEKALLSAGIKLGLRKSELEKLYKRIDEIPFDPAIKYMATLHHYQAGKKIIFVKGAPEKIFAMSAYIDRDGKKEKLTAELIAKLSRRYESLSNKGLRILAFAFEEVGLEEMNLEKFNQEKKKLIFVGLVAIKDPLRPEAKETVKLAQEAGIKVVMITGDHRLTAQSIAEELGLPAKSENIIDGEQLDKISEHELKNRVRDISVYARVSPAHKIRIVDAWQASGEVVAMTGDGINDAPALKSANIGIALGSGTDVAKSASDLVLLDDNFRTIEKAVEQGRVVFDNIKKVILYLLSDGFAEITLIMGSLIFGFPLPVLAAQILWVNLVDDVLPALAITMEPGEAVMKDKPQGLKGQIFTREMKVLIGLISVTLGILSLIFFYYFWKKTGDLTLARTMAFVLLGASTLFYAFSVRSIRYPIWRKNPFSNLWLVGALVISFGLQIMPVYIPFLQGVMRTESLNIFHWLDILGASLLIIIAIEIVKYIFLRNRYKEKTS